MGDAQVGTPRVLVVDDDPTLCEIVSRYLQRAGMTTHVVHDGIDGLTTALVTKPDLVVLDLMLPGIDGIEVFRRLRAESAVPVVMLTARGDERDRIAGLDLGADDYVTKPFSPRELVSRVRAVLRRTQAAPSARVMRAGTIELDVVARRVLVGGAETPLTVKEFELLAHLMSHPDRAFRRDELLEAVWGYTLGDTATVTVHMRRLREKVEANPSLPRHLRTVQGVGYRFEP